MSHNQKEQKAAELLHTQLSAEENNTLKEQSNSEQKPEELIEREQIENTPFDIVGNKDKGYFLAMGRFRLTEPQPTKQDAKDLLRRDMWNIISNIMVIFTDFAKHEIIAYLGQKESQPKVN